MYAMFYSASAFDQDLGWCVDEDVDLEYAFDETKCETSSCGVQTMEEGTCAPTPVPTPRPTPQPTTPQPTPNPTPDPTQRPVMLTGYVMTDSTIRTAVTAWLWDASAAESTYGHISTWGTRGVTDMSYLFCQDSTSSCFTAASAFTSFNDDISAWDTSGVTSMDALFYRASAFNQGIGGWAVDSVTSMSGIFSFDSAFNQDLGWCVDDDVSLSGAFFSTPCESTSCGVTQDDACAPPTARPTPNPTPNPSDPTLIEKTLGDWRLYAAGVAVALVLVLGFYGGKCLANRSGKSWGGVVTAVRARASNGRVVAWNI